MCAIRMKLILIKTKMRDRKINCGGESITKVFSVFARNRKKINVISEVSLTARKNCSLC